MSDASLTRMRPRLVRRTFLDPRERAGAVAVPIGDSVNIPLAELPQRAHELPSRRGVVLVAASPDLAQRTIESLKEMGRQAIARTDFEFVPAATTQHDIGRLWEPAEFLKCTLPQIPTGAALDVACGAGRDAAFMASLGWDVTAVDILPDAIERGRSIETACAPAVLPIHWLVADLESPGFRPESRFDLIVGFRYLHRPLLTRLADWLNPGGHIIYETFTALHRQRFGKPAREAFVLQSGELRSLLAYLDVHDNSEGWRDDENAHTARIWGSLPGGAAPRTPLIR